MTLNSDEDASPRLIADRTASSRRVSFGTGLVLAIVVAADTATAQLIVGNDDFSAGAQNAWNVDPSSGSSQLLWGGGNPEVWGMAFGNGTLFVSAGVELYAGPFPSTPALVGDITVDGTGVSMVGLAFDSSSGHLYGSRTVASASAPEGIYQIDPNSGAASLAVALPAASDFDFGGIDFNPADGLIYAVNDTNGSQGRGLFSIDLSDGAITKIASYPTGETDIDGLAIGEGKAFLVEDEPGASIHVYDLAASAYVAPIVSPMPTAEVFSGATYVPEPGTLALGCAALAIGTRRRRTWNPMSSSHAIPTVHLACNRRRVRA